MLQKASLLTSSSQSMENIHKVFKSVLSDFNIKNIGKVETDFIKTLPINKNESKRYMRTTSQKTYMQKR